MSGCFIATTAIVAPICGIVGAILGIVIGWRAAEERFSSNAPTGGEGE